MITPYAHTPPEWKGSLKSGGSDISVNMIVRNEAPYLTRALASLIPLQAREVIIADTGSTDETKEIAEWFGCKVIDVPWKDHFGDARNAVLDESSCEWVVWIDGDEQFADGSASRLRMKLSSKQLVGNYQLFVLSEYPYEMYQSRMFRRLPSARWRGRVHENVWPDGGEVQSHDDIVIIQHPDDRRLAKYDRNLALLKMAIEDDPTDGRNYLHASILMLMKGEFDKAEEFGDSYLRTSRRDELKPRVYVLYSKAWMALTHKRDLQKAANLIASGLAMDTSAAELWCLLGDVYQWAKRPSDAIAAYENALVFGKASTGTFWLVDKSKYDEYPRGMIDKLRAAGVTDPPVPTKRFGAGVI
jgi:hypothetical protein